MRERGPKRHNCARLRRCPIGEKSPAAWRARRRNKRRERESVKLPGALRAAYYEWPSLPRDEPDCLSLHTTTPAGHPRRVCASGGGAAHQGRGEPSQKVAPTRSQCVSIETVSNLRYLIRARPARRRSTGANETAQTDARMNESAGLRAENPRRTRSRHWSETGRTDG